MITPFGAMVYMFLPGLWINLRHLARVIGHVFDFARAIGLLYENLP